MNPGSAVISFNGLDTRCGVFQIYARGMPDTIKMALRKACSHRRRLVTTRPSVYFVNCTHELLALVGSDNMDYMGPDRDDKTYNAIRPTVNWGYRIWLKNRAPTISYSDSTAEPIDIGFFTFLGMEHVRPYNHTAARRKRRGGRPPALRSKHPEIYSNLKPKAVRVQQSLTRNAAAQSGDALGLKDKPKWHVDFTGVPSIDRTRGETIAMFEAPEDVPISKRELNEEIRDLKGKLEMSDEEAHELDDLYGEEIRG